MSKLKDVGSCIIDAQYLAYLMEIAADGLKTPEGGAISGAARIAIEKLTEAMNLLVKRKPRRSKRKPSVRRT